MFHSLRHKPSQNVAVTTKSIASEPRKQSRTAKPWRPVTLRAPYLVSLILVTALLIAVIQWLLAISRREQGIIFAEDINELPLRRSFCYLYLPTIISVIYSFLWTWVDLDVKRLEPYFQLSKPGGATGAESILLNYPLEFLVTIPLNAFKRKHWSVLTASLITILVFWGLTPTQAGIFATRTVDVISHANASLSKDYTPVSKQGNLTSIYAQSVYNIAWLNESLPPFMTREYVLGAFGPTEKGATTSASSNFTGVTSLYSVDVSCQHATTWNRSGTWYYNSSTGCSFSSPRYRPSGGTDLSKPYDTLYVGYQNQNGFADYDLSSYCGESFFHLFFIRWSKSTAAAIRSAEEPGNLELGQANETSLFCSATYYQQKVNATISLPSNAVLVYQPTGSKSPLPADLFNVSAFEWTMSSGQEPVSPRGEYPTTSFPDQKTELAGMPLNLAYIPKMAPFAIATYLRDAEAYMDPETLRLSYQSAYRLLFARQLVDILSPNLTDKQNETGHREYRIQAVVVVPTFAYVATALLSCIGSLAILLFVITIKRPNELQNDPAALGDLMDLTFGDRIRKRFSQARSSGKHDLEEKLGGLSFQLMVHHDSKEVQIDTVEPSPGHSQLESTEDDKLLDPRFTDDSVRPTEMKLAVGWVFLALQIAALITFSALFAQARQHGGIGISITDIKDDRLTAAGLPLPSTSTFVRQLVENYVPIAFATFIEPFWLVLNRLIGLLQPYEELRKGNAQASKSIELDYSSLPPQLLLFRGLRAKHYVLSLLCLMVLLANALSVALSGLMYEDTVEISHTGSLAPLNEAHIRILNGTGLPFNTNQTANSQGGTTSAPFYREMSNMTANTPLPAWTDEKYAYVPMDVSRTNATSTIQLTTHAFGADLQCKPLNLTGDDKYRIDFESDAAVVHLAVTLKDSNGKEVNCTNSKPWTRSYSTAQTSLDYLRESQPGRVALELNGMLSSNSSNDDNLFCRQHMLSGWLRAEWMLLTGRESGQSNRGLPKMHLTSYNATVLLCKPTIEVGPAEVLIDSSGRVRNLSSANTSSSSLDSYFTSTPADLVAQANQFLIDSDATWHTDSYPSDYLNYLIRQLTNDTTLLDPSLPVPSTAKAATHLADVYRRLFAILISTNIDYLLNPANPNTPRVQATITKPETRILFSTPAFIVTELILVAYILTTILFYARRPWRVLPRLPSTVASNIAYFAGSRALADQAGLADTEERKRVRMGWRWGYGEMVGSGGIGIEREPYVGVVTALQKKNLETRRRKG